MRSYNRILFLTALTILSVVVAVNVVTDPFWYFGTTNALNTRKCNFDERVQKINLLLNMPPRYDALLFGSSRVSFMEPKLFKLNTLFNYALGSMYPDEYDGYIAAARLRHPVRTVYIGLDFFGTSKYKMFPADHSPKENVQGALSPMRKLGALLSGDGLKYAFRSARMSLGRRSDDGDYYDSDYVKHMADYSRDQQEAVIFAQLELYHEKGYGPRYQWNSDQPELFSALRLKNPDIRFVVFTTPISAPMFSLLVRDGRLPDYERWLRLLVEHFAEVHDFMGFNSVTENLGNYADAHHFLPPVDVFIADRLEGRDVGVPADFGVLVTAQNLDDHLTQIKRQAERADPDPMGTWGRRARNSGAGASAAHD